MVARRQCAWPDFCHHQPTSGNLQPLPWVQNKLAVGGVIGFGPVWRHIGPSGERSETASSRAVVTGRSRLYLVPDASGLLIRGVLFSAGLLRILLAFKTPRPLTPLRQYSHSRLGNKSYDIVNMMYQQASTIFKASLVCIPKLKPRHQRDAVSPWKF